MEDSFLKLLEDTCLKLEGAIRANK